MRRTVAATGAAAAVAVGLLSAGTGVAEAAPAPDLSVAVTSYTCDATGKYVNLTVSNSGGEARGVRVNGFVSNWGYARQVPVLGARESVDLPIKIPFPTLGWQPQGVVVYGGADSNLLNNAYAGFTYPVTLECSAR